MQIEIRVIANPNNHLPKSCLPSNYKYMVSSEIHKNSQQSKINMPKSLFLNDEYKTFTRKKYYDNDLNEFSYKIDKLCPIYFICLFVYIFMLII